ncbi:MAG: CRISPR-associated protein [Methanoregulaceae archaeon PtaB.Bin009]|nr:MAG: CRISPR-associated protein [Methanoregulaceae archaeon PtaB.Bin009]OPY47461.1 MAG: CRISPR-associated protein [Methanoregulaceae archaeon PtaU1.Bin222]
MKSTYFTITPRDPVIARDARPFGFGIRMKSLDWPYPSVLAGSLRTMFGKTEKAGDFSPDTVMWLKGLAISGPFPLVDGSLFFPAPKDILLKDLRNDRFEAFPLRPAEMGKGQGCDLPHPGLLPAMLPQTVTEEFKPAKSAPFWSLKTMVSWLTEDTDASFSNRISPVHTGADSLQYPEKDARIHTKIVPERGVADDGMLFETVGLDFTAKRKSVGDQVRIAARMDSNGGCSMVDTLHPFGGERRLAHWKSCAGHTGWTCPDEIKTSVKDSERVRMVLATPAIFTGGWLPGWLGEKNGCLVGSPPGGPDDLVLRLVSACVDRWKPLSGWSLETRGPKAIRRVVPAGSVYFFETEKGSAAALAERCWLQSVSDDPQDRLDGFGLTLWGTWNNSKKGSINDKGMEE